MKKIIFIGHEPLTVRTRQIFFLESFIKNNFEIEYWDLSNYFYKGLKLTDIVDEKYIKKIHKFEELVKELECIEISKTIFIIEIYNIWKNRKIFKLLKKNACYSVHIEMYATAILPLSKKEKFKNANIAVLSSALINKIKNTLYKLYQKLHNFKPYDLSITSNPNTARTESVVQVNHIDFERALLLKDTDKIVQEKYIVFIDDYFPKHPDIVTVYGIKPIGIDKYRNELVTFFERVEMKFGVIVVIASHPKSRYDSEFYKGRRVIKYLTCELVRDSEAIIMHSSAAISFATVYKKPIILTYTNLHQKRYKFLYSIVKHYSEYFNIPAHNISSETDFPNNLPQIDQKNYNLYKYTYLTSLYSEDKKTEDIILETFKNL